MTKKIDIEEIKQKMFKKLEPSGWSRILKSFIFSSDFENVVNQLVKFSKDNKRFTPTLNQMFRAFEECPYDKLKVVIVGQDPYPKLGVADGIAFSCSNTQKQQPNLKFILDEVNRTVYDGVGQSHDPDLKRWANQGILLLNTALTTTVGKVGQHIPIWKPFLAYVFDWLTWHNPGLIYIYMGKQAQDWAECVNDTSYKFMVNHPASAVYNKGQNWDCKDVFNKTNKILLKNNNLSLTW
jgi:uracil-DNA glycosylase